MTRNNNTPVDAPRRRPLILRLLPPLLVLAAAAVATLWMLETGPQAKPRPRTRNATLVEVRPVDFAPQPTMIEALGTVRAAREVELRPQVGGEVVELSGDLVPGGLFLEGEKLLSIDPADYELEVRQFAGEVARAESELRLEEGNQLVARREFELLGEEVSAEERGLMLREPQMETLRAALESARARLEQARLDLSRTVIAAPFNAVIRSRGVNLGTRVTPTTLLATLAGTDEYWVEVSVPVSQLRWIRIPRGDGEEGSTVRIYDRAAWGEGAFREGRVIRLSASLEEEGRMARLLVRVEDPLAMAPDHAEAPQMLIGSYVRAEIDGLGLPAAAAVDREFLHDGETVWVMDAEGKLDIRTVEIAFRGRDRVLVTGGLTEGEHLVVSDLPAPVPGMPLRLSEEGGQ